MLDKPITPDQQGVRDFLIEGVTSLSAVEMHRVLENCGYEHQRSINARHVTVLADLMKRGRWQPKSQIDFAVINGRYVLINGYHRAYAQVRSGKTISWSIALHPARTEADLRALYYAFDTNVRIRNSREILAATEFASVHDLPAEVAKSLYGAIPFISSRFATKQLDRNFLIDKQVDRRLELAAEYAKAAGRLAACLEGLPAYRRMKFKSGAVTAVAVVTFRYQSTTAWEFWSGVVQNDGLKRGDPRLALCNDFMSRKGLSGNGAATFAPSIIAWNAFFNERPLHLIKVMDSFVPVIDGTPFDGKPVKVS